MPKQKPVRLHKIAIADQRELIDALIATGALKVTRCPDFVRPNLHARRGGGMMPSHLNPLTIGMTREEVEALEQEKADA